MCILEKNEFFFAKEAAILTETALGGAVNDTGSSRSVIATTISITLDATMLLTVKGKVEEMVE